jgi:hypothetical protein
MYREFIIIKAELTERRLKARKTFPPAKKKISKISAPVHLLSKKKIKHRVRLGMCAGGS